MSAGRCNFATFLFELPGKKWTSFCRCSAGQRGRRNNRLRLDAGDHHAFKPSEPAKSISPLHVDHSDDVAITR